ncbi:MAG TPA: DUF4235 domain-containing protein [Longimicrobiaceae bacterium]
MKKTRPRTRSAAWLAVSGGAALLASTAAERALRTGWRAVRGVDPPHRPGKHVGWAQAIAWTAATAALVAVVELLAREGAERGWEKLTGHRISGE